MDSSADTKGRNMSPEEMRCESNNSSGRSRGPMECKSGSDHGSSAASSATRLPYYAAMQSAISFRSRGMSLFGPSAVKDSERMQVAGQRHALCPNDW